MVYHLSKAELDKWDADHAIEMSESSHTLSGRKLSIMTPSRNPNALSAKNSTGNPETEIWRGDLGALEDGGGCMIDIKAKLTTTTALPSSANYCTFSNWLESNFFEPWTLNHQKLQTPPKNVWVKSHKLCCYCARQANQRKQSHSVCLSPFLLCKSVDPF